MQNIENYFNNVDQIIGKKIGVSAQQLRKYENAKNIYYLNLLNI